jgi:hypothetical protein
LSSEIILPNIPNGGKADLGHRFVSIFHSTNCPTIVGILTP